MIKIFMFISVKFIIFICGISKKIPVHFSYKSNGMNLSELNTFNLEKRHFPH